jgi:hypothetical protein
VTATEAETVPARAVTLVVPTFTAVIEPSATDTMLGSSALHTTLAETVRPSFAVTVAAMLVVAPDTRVIGDDGDSVMPAGVLSVGFGPVLSPPPPPHAAPNTAAAIINKLERRIGRI